MNPDPLRPAETDVALPLPDPLLLPPMGYSMGVKLGFLLALACGFIAGVLVMWVLR